MKSTALLWRTEWINKHMKIHIFHILVCALKVLFCSSLWACPSLPLCWDLTEGRDHEVFPCLHPQSLACCLIQEVLNKQWNCKGAREPCRRNSPQKAWWWEGWSQEPCLGRAIHSLAFFVLFCLTHVFPWEDTRTDFSPWDSSLYFSLHRDPPDTDVYHSAVILTYSSGSICLVFHLP